MIRRWSHALIRWGVGLVTLLVVSAAWAQSIGETTNATTEEAPLEGQRNIGVLLTIGSYTGFGAGVQLGTPAVGIRASAGWVPLLVSYTLPEQDSQLKLYSGYQLAGDAYMRGMQGKRGANIGVTSGYRYHRLLGSGIALGAYATFRLNRVVEGFVQGGLVWFFSGEDRLRQERGEIPDEAEFSWPGPSVNYLISLGILLFP